MPHPTPTRACICPHTDPSKCQEPSLLAHDRTSSADPYDMSCAPSQTHTCHAPYVRTDPMSCTCRWPWDRDPTDRIHLDQSQYRANPTRSLPFCNKAPALLRFTNRSSHSGSFFAVHSFSFCFGPKPLVSLQFSPCTFIGAYLGRFSSVSSVLYVHAFVSKCRLVFCSCFALLVLFSACFLFIIVVCLYVNIVERREWSVRRLWRSRCAWVWAAESCWRQVSLDAYPLILYNMHLIHCIYFWLH
jgi:hypothetical protein